MTDYVLSIDPGVSTGVALLSYDDDTAPELVQGWQIGGGLAGFLEWTETNLILSVHDYDQETDFVGISDWPGWVPFTTISEKFQPINHSNYALTTVSVEPLRVEGAMVALGMMLDYAVEEKQWRRPIDQYVFGGKTKAERKKRMHSALKELGFYRTGKDLGAPDADDFRSACAHALSYLAKAKNHKPTWMLISDWAEKN